MSVNHLITFMRLCEAIQKKTGASYRLTDFVFHYVWKISFGAKDKNIGRHRNARRSHIGISAITCCRYQPASRQRISDGILHIAGELLFYAWSTDGLNWLRVLPDNYRVEVPSYSLKSGEEATSTASTNSTALPGYRSCNAQT